MSSVDKVKEFVEYLEKAKIPKGTYKIHAEDSIPVIYKYVSSERVFTCLPDVGDGTLRATQPSALNDPFECAVLKTFVERNEEEGNIEFSRILTDLNPTSVVSEMDVAEARLVYGSLYVRELLSRQLSKRLGVVSFATNPRHPLMWAHYTGDGSGFVIGYDMTQLVKLSSREGCLRPIVYGHKPSLILGYPVLNEENINALLSQKSDHWNYEQEWRLIIELNETIGTGYTDRHDQPINLLRIPNEAVMYVYHTERTPIEVVSKVRRRLEDANNRYRAKPSVKLVLSEGEYVYEDAEE